MPSTRRTLWLLAPQPDCSDQFDGRRHSSSCQIPQEVESAERRRARQKSVDLHMRLLVHSSSCKIPLPVTELPEDEGNIRRCSSSYLACLTAFSSIILFSFLGPLEHTKVCTARASKTCQICRRVLLCCKYMPANAATIGSVLHCKVFRERIRQMQRQQNQVS